MLSLRYREGVLSLRCREGVLSLRYREGPPCSEGRISFCLFSPLLRGVNASLLAFEKHVVLVGGGLATAFGFGHLNTTLSPFAMASNPAGVCAGASPPTATGAASSPAGVCADASSPLRCASPSSVTPRKALCSMTPSEGAVSRPNRCHSTTSSTSRSSAGGRRGQGFIVAFPGAAGRTDGEGGDTEADVGEVGS